MPKPLHLSTLVSYLAETKPMARQLRVRSIRAIETRTG
jgi:hypothetical protein